MKHSFWMQMFQKWMQNRLRMNLWRLWGKKNPHHFWQWWCQYLSNILFSLSFHTSELTPEVNFFTPFPSLGVYPRQPTLLPQQSHQEWGRSVRLSLLSRSSWLSISASLPAGLQHLTPFLWVMNSLLRANRADKPFIWAFGGGDFLASLPETFSSAGRWCLRQPIAKPREGEKQQMRWGRNIQMLWIRFLKAEKTTLSPAW